MVQKVFDPVITIHLWHAELTRQGEGVDGGCERLVSSVDKVVNITGHLPLESVHHNLHLFLYRLHLCDDRWRSRICEGREAHVLSLRFAWGVIGLGNLLVSSIDAGSLLISSLVVRCYVFLAQLFQVAILFGEVFHGRSENLNLLFEGDCGWFLFLNVVSGCHLAGEHHATFVREVVLWLYTTQLPTDGAN